MLKKIIWNKIFFLILYIISFILADDYEINLDGLDCSNSPSYPPYKEACLSYNTEESACCYATILFKNRTTVNKCIPIPKGARFALNFLTIFSFKDNENKEYKDVTATFECGQKDKYCGMDSPCELFQCSEHSSTTQSCCFLSTPTYTECVLSDEKYDKETTFKLFNTSYVVCHSNKIIIKNLINFFYIIIVINIINVIVY